MSRPWDKDRFMSPDIDAVTKILQEEKVWQAVRNHVEEYNEIQVSPFFSLSSFIFNIILLFPNFFLDVFSTIKSDEFSLSPVIHTICTKHKRKKPSFVIHYILHIKFTHVCIYPSQGCNTTIAPSIPNIQFHFLNYQFFHSFDNNPLVVVVQIIPEQYKKQYLDFISLLQI